ncbi:MAG: hypothetical protein IPJ75_15925 [Ignavibacteriales bacterium]|nr:hypothetical protein [Ignavibacteriales bacterium]
MIKELNNIPEGVSKVDKPDHPFAFDGPDMLLYNSNGLLAIFYLRPKEIQSPSKVIVRLTNALMVYPPYTRMIFLYDQSKELQESNGIKFEYYFDEVIEPSDIKKKSLYYVIGKMISKLKELREYKKKYLIIKQKFKRTILN